MTNDIPLQISFPKSSEDHRLQLVEINGSIFAILHSPLESNGPIRLNCENWSLILMAPIKSKTNILISAINVVCLSEISSQEGSVNIHASNRLVKFAVSISSPKPISEMGEKGEYVFKDDPGLFLFYFRNFESVLQLSLTDHKTAGKQFVTCLSTIAEKIKEETRDLTIQKVLQIWNIPILKKD